MPIDLLFDGPRQARWTIALAHGAGAGMDTPFMQWLAEGLAGQGFRVARFEFPFMAGRRTSGKKRPPDRLPVLMGAWHEVIGMLGKDRLIIGGKSMGGRIASMVADDADVAGLVCLGYPFHPAGKPDQTRVEHLRTITTPTLILQGARDPFGTEDEVADYELSPAIRLHWLPDGDHDLKPRKASGRTQQENVADALTAIQGFVVGSV
jgi:uncharacterized protein